MSSARHGIIHRVFSRDFNRLVARYPEGHREIGAGRMRAGLPSAKLRDTKPIRRNGQTLSKYVRDGRAPVPRSPIISEVMSANRARNTQPELTLRRALRRLGVSGYRLHPSGLPGRPDLALPKARLAVFVHGCFWHRCPSCSLPLPKSHQAFWSRKFDRNRKRDREKIDALTRVGWRPIVIWECQLKANPMECAVRVIEAVGYK